MNLSNSAPVKYFFNFILEKYEFISILSLIIMNFRDQIKGPFILTESIFCRKILFDYMKVI